MIFDPFLFPSIPSIISKVTTLEADIALEFESLFVNFLFLHVFPEAEIKKGNFFSVQKNNLRKF